MPRDETVSSFLRGLAVIRSFGAGQRRQSIAEVAARTGLTRASARRFLNTLCEAGYARMDGKLFELTPAVLELGHAFISASSELEVVRGELQGITADLNESASAAMMDGTDIIYVARSPARHRIMTIGLSVGVRLPAHATSMGQALLAALSARELDAYLAAARLEAMTPHTLTTPEALRARLDEVRGRGYALVSEELEIGLSSVAVAIPHRLSERSIAINISTQKARVGADEIKARYLPRLMTAAARIASAMA